MARRSNWPRARHRACLARGLPSEYVIQDAAKFRLRNDSFDSPAVQLPILEQIQSATIVWNDALQLLHNLVQRHLQVERRTEDACDIAQDLGTLPLTSLGRQKPRVV